MSIERLMWKAMVGRCHDRTHRRYQNRRGKRRVYVCERYQGSFDDWIADLGPRPNCGHVELIDPSGHYSCGKCFWCQLQRWPANIRWGTPKPRPGARPLRTTRWVSYQGATMPLNAAARMAGIPPATLDYHLRVLGRTVEEAVAAIRGGIKRGRPRNPMGRTARRARKIEALRAAGELAAGVSPNFRRDRKLFRRAKELLEAAMRRPAGSGQ